MELKTMAWHGKVLKSELFEKNIHLLLIFGFIFKITLKIKVAKTKQFLPKRKKKKSFSWHLVIKIQIILRVLATK